MQNFLKPTISFSFTFLIATILIALTALAGCNRKSDTSQPKANTLTNATTTTAAASTASSDPAAANSSASAKAAFNIESVPISTIALPPFPYLDWPKGLPEGGQFVIYKSNFDSAAVIVGDQLRNVEGRIENRRFSPDDVQMSQLASQRNYEAAIKAIGGVKVNTVLPDAPAFIQANGGDVGALLVNKLKLYNYVDAYDTYLIRTADKNIWIVLVTSASATQILVVEEKAMQQLVGFVSADAMQSELTSKGRVTLYINFDTDKALIKTDGQSVVDEIAKLLAKDAALKLSIEGHTDNVGNAQRNKTLSKQRADAVVSTLTAKGVDKARLSAEGFGADKPIADNASEEGRAKNRRVELVKK